MLSLNQSSKRKAPLGGTVPCRMSEKSDKAKIKLGMQAYLSKPGSTILSHKSTDISKISKTAMITPKSGPVKQSLKENCASPQSTVRYRCSQNVYTSPTHSSTPIDI